MFGHEWDDKPVSSRVDPYAIFLDGFSAADSFVLAYRGQETTTHVDACLQAPWHEAQRGFACATLIPIASMAAFLSPVDAFARQWSHTKWTGIPPLDAAELVHLVLGVGPDVLDSVDGHAA